MPARIANLGGPNMDTGAYIRRGPPGPIAEVPTVSYPLKVFRKFLIISQIFSETWSPVSVTALFCVLWWLTLFVLWTN